MKTVRETLEWRIIAFAITFLITYLWTGKLLDASGLAIALNLTKTVAFYLWMKYKKGHIRSLLRKLKANLNENS